MELYTTQYFLKALLQLGVLWISLSLHEFGHAFVADKMGDPTPRMLGRLTVNPIAHMDMLGTVLIPMLRFIFPAAGAYLIGWAKPVPISPVNFRNQRRGEILVSLAGPGMNLIIILFFLLVLVVGNGLDWFTATEGMVPQFLELAGYFILLNFILMVFNLFPIPPLDGHWILKAALPGKWSYQYMRMAPYGMYIVLALLFSGYLSKMFYPFVFLLYGVMYLLGLGELWNRMMI